MRTEPVIAYISGDTPPDFAAIAAFGFDVVCLDTAASWFNASMLATASAHGLTPIAFRMGYIAPENAASRRTQRGLGSA